MTIFATLSMVLVAAVLFSLFEAARYHELHRILQLQTESALESCFATYNSNLWEEYRLLGCEDSGMVAQIREIGNERNSASQHGLNLLQAEVGEISLQSYTRITDGEGRVFKDAAASYMKEQIVYETIQNLYNQYEVIASLIKGGEIDLSKIDEAIQSIENVQKQAIETRENAGEIVQQEQVREELNTSQMSNPLEVISDLQQKGILELVVPKDHILSEKKIAQTGLVSNRKLQKGVDSQVSETEWIDNVLFQQYLLSYFSNYLNVQENTCLSYEIEYIIGGKSTDIENLKLTVQQILGIREIINFLYLVSDAQAQETAGGLAIALVGATVNPIVIETVKIGILTAWAFGESILDVRALLLGQKVPLLKSKETWTLSLAEVARLGQVDFVAKESPNGITYANYLGILLLFQQEKELSFRAMDLQELYIQKVCEEPMFRMDEICVQAKIGVEYVYHPIFRDFTDVFWSDRSIRTEAVFSYH